MQRASKGFRGLLRRLRVGHGARESPVRVGGAARQEQGNMGGGKKRLRRPGEGLAGLKGRNDCVRQRGQISTKKTYLSYY